MLPNYRGLLAIIPPAVLRALTSQSAVLRFSRAAILAGLLPVWEKRGRFSSFAFHRTSSTPPAAGNRSLAGRSSLCLGRSPNKRMPV